MVGSCYNEELTGQGSSPKNQRRQLLTGFYQTFEQTRLLTVHKHMKGQCQEVELVLSK